MESPEAGLDLFPPPPSRVWIGAGQYAVEMVDPADPRLDDARAITIFEPAAVLVDRERPAREKFELVWHELTHAVNYEFALEQPRKRLNEERVAHVHGKAWTQVFIDNPALVDWIGLAANYIKSEQEEEHSA